MRCDRCGVVNDTVVVITSCRECGPTPLCDECEKVHRGEIELEESLRGLDRYDD